jgi:predicted aminopeptidase
MFRFVCCSLLTAALPIIGAGCQNLDYALTVAIGELQLLSAAVPIEAALEADTTLTDEQREKLELIIRARDYAESTIGLNVGGSFRNFVNLHGEPLSWNLSASHKDAFEPFIWDIPVIGPIPYIGYFDKDAAVAERDRIVELGYDTYLYEVDAFSTIGMLPDPVASSLLRRSIGSLIETVMHESLHNTIWHSGRVTFNESLATFVGRTAGVEFLVHEFGQEDDVVTQTLLAYEDADRLNAFLLELADELEILYASDVPSERKIADRDEIFEAARVRFNDEVLPLMNVPEHFTFYGAYRLNNAFVLARVRYFSGQEVFQDVFEQCGRDWACALAVFAEAARTTDPLGYLKAHDR